MSQFQPFFRIDLSHDYFGTGHPPISILPDRSTTMLAGMPALHMRRGTGWIEVYADADRGTLRQLADSKSLAFTFRLREISPNVASVTAGLSDVRGRIAVIDRDLDQSGPLHAGDILGEADFRPLEVGKLIEPGDVAQPPLAVLRLRPDPEARDLRCTLRFGAAERFWTYHVMGSRENATLGIRDREDAISFEALGEKRMANGMQALSFRSSRPIPARARPENRFELVSEGPFGPRVLLSSLPSPRPGPGRIEKHGNQKRAVSEIYLSLL